MSDRFDELMASLEIDGIRLNQHVPEWKAFLEYASGYFLARNITHPIVVEIGILDGAQRRFYEKFIGAEYIGIDSGKERSMVGKPDITGDSRKLETREKLETWLGGRRIDLLFIDGDHTYDGVKSDYETYGPMTKHIIAFHDIHTPKLGPNDSVDVARLWAEILAMNKSDTIITVQHHNPRQPEEFNGRPLGIGIVVKETGA